MTVTQLCNSLKIKILRQLGWIKFVFSCILITAFIILWLYESDSCKKECAFHHLKSNLLKPFYTFRCPETPPKRQIDEKHNIYSACDDLPPIIMLNARPMSARLHAARSWLNQELLVINTTFMGKSIFECPETTWSNNLFNTYLKVFDYVLKTYPFNETDFIFVEDDAELLDAEQMRIDACIARVSQYKFYSFFRTPQQGNTCIYQWGTQAFYITRKLMKKVLEEVDHHTLCYIPIDMYMAMLGPWYATRSNIIKHNSLRFHPYHLILDIQANAKNTASHNPLLSMSVFSNIFSIFLFLKVCIEIQRFGE